MPAIGSKRRELGHIEPDGGESPTAAGSEADDISVEDEDERGRLTSDEKAAVMLDLCPRSLNL
jgi:hypothetical protein